MLVLRLTRTDSLSFTQTYSTFLSHSDSLSLTRIHPLSLRKKSHSDLFGLIKIHAISRRFARLHPVSLGFDQIHEVHSAPFRFTQLCSNSLNFRYVQIGSVSIQIHTASHQVCSASLRLVQTQYSLFRLAQIHPH